MCRDPLSYVQMAAYCHEQYHWIAGAEGEHPREPKYCLDTKAPRHPRFCRYFNLKSLGYHEQPSTRLSYHLASL